MAGRRKKPEPRRPEEVRAAEETFLSCPGKHRLPHRTAAGECTPLYCATPTAAKVREEKREAQEPVTEDKLMAIEAQTTDNELASLTKARTRARVRAEFLQTPQGLTGADAEEWADRRLVELLPEAVARLEFNLRFGNDDQADKAAEKIMNATGRGKREAGGGGTTPMVFLIPEKGQTAVQIPWAQRVEPAKLVPVAPSEDKGDKKP